MITESESNAHTILTGRFVRRAGLLVGQIALLAVIVYLAQGRARQAWQALDWSRLSLRPEWLWGAVCLQSGFFVLAAYSWARAARAVGSGIGARRAIPIWLITQPYKYLPSGLGIYVGRSVLFLRGDNSPQRLVQSSTIELTLMVLTGAIFAAPLALGNGARAASVLIALGLLPLLLIGLRWLQQSRWAGTWPLRHLLRWSGLAALPWLDLAVLSLWFAARWLVLGLILVALAAAMRLDAVRLFWPFVSIYACAWTVGFLSPLPGGLGVREVTLTALLANVLPQSALTIAVVARLIWMAGEAITVIGGWAWTRGAARSEKG